MSKVYLIEGSIGEYSDFRTWIVAAFLIKKDAIEFKKKLERKAKLKKESGEASADMVEAYFIHGIPLFRGLKNE